MDNRELEQRITKLEREVKRIKDILFGNNFYDIEEG